jgi:hypothetical protein
MLVALFLSTLSLACDIFGYQGAQLAPIGVVVLNEVRGFRNGRLQPVGRVVGGLIQSGGGDGPFAVVGKFAGPSVYSFAANQFSLVGKVEGETIFAYTGESFTRAGTAKGCASSQAAAGALLLALRSVW